MPIVTVTHYLKSATRIACLERKCMFPLVPRKGDYIIFKDEEMEYDIDRIEIHEEGKIQIYISIDKNADGSDCLLDEEHLTLIISNKKNAGWELIGLDRN